MILNKLIYTIGGVLKNCARSSIWLKGYDNPSHKIGFGFYSMKMAHNLEQIFRAFLTASTSALFLSHHIIARNYAVRDLSSQKKQHMHCIANGTRNHTSVIMPPFSGLYLWQQSDVHKWSTLWNRDKTTGESFACLISACWVDIKHATLKEAGYPHNYIITLSWFRRPTKLSHVRKSASGVHKINASQHMGHLFSSRALTLYSVRSIQTPGICSHWKDLR